MNQYFVRVAETVYLITTCITNRFDDLQFVNYCIALFVFNTILQTLVFKSNDADYRCLILLKQALYIIFFWEQRALYSFLTLHIAIDCIVINLLMAGRVLLMSRINQLGSAQFHLYQLLVDIYITIVLARHVVIVMRNGLLLSHVSLL